MCQSGGCRIGSRRLKDRDLLIAINRDILEKIAINCDLLIAVNRDILEKIAINRDLYDVLKIMVSTI